VTCSCLECVNSRPKLTLTSTSISNLSPCLLCIVAYLSCDQFNDFCPTRGKIATVFASRGKIAGFCLTRQNRKYQLYWLLCNWLSGFGFGLDIGVHNFIFSDMDWKWSRWKSFGLDQDCKIYISVHHWSAAELGSNELLQRADFPVASAGVSLCFEKNNGCGSKLSPFYRYRYSLLWREWWPKEKVCKSSSVSTRWSQLLFSLFCTDFGWFVCIGVPFGLGTYVEVWGFAQRRSCLQGILSLHAEMLVSPNTTKEAA